MLGGSRSTTKKLQEFSGSENEDALLVFDREGELASKRGEEFLDEEEEEGEQPERSSFVNSNTRRELRGAWREVRD